MLFWSAAYYRNTREAVLVQKSIIRALGRLFYYRRVLLDHWKGCAGTEEYYNSIEEAMLLQKSATGALERLCWYSRVI